MSFPLNAPWRTLRGRVLLVILLGMAAPTALLAPWLGRSAQRSGEELLRERLESSLVEAANAVGTRWITHRSLLLRIAEDPAVIAALRGGPSLEPPHETQLRQAWAGLDGVADALVLRDTRGRVYRTLRHAPVSQEAAPVSPLVPVWIPVLDRDGERLGTLEVRLRLGSLFPAGLWWSGVGGSVLALFDGAGELPLSLPSSMRPELFRSDRFDWGGDQWIVVHRQLHDPVLHFALAAPLGPISAPFSRAARQGALALLAVLLGGLVLSVLLTRRVTDPLERMARAADEVARGRFEQRVGEQGPDELRRLGRAFNLMTESLRATLQKLSQREAVAAVGEFAASLAHEVRNPLTSIRLDLERAGERLNDPRRAGELLSRAIAEIDRLDATVSGSLRIARSGRLELCDLDLRQPLRAALHAAAPAFAARGARLEPPEPPDPPVTVRGNAGALEQLFLNLLLNAAEALPPGGSARVAVEPGPDGVRVLVRDDGPGMGPDELDRVREPFYTTKEHGTGLGLPIAQRIAQAHGAELRLESTAGAGTTASVVLPWAAG